MQHIICCCEAMARQHYNVFGRLTVEPKDISTASIRDLCLFIRGAGLLLNEILRLHNKPKAAVRSVHKLTGPKKKKNMKKCKQTDVFTVICFLLGNSPASQC